MEDRAGIERLLHELYAARVHGQLERLCGLFAPDASFQIAGSSEGKPVTIVARGADDIRSWLGIMLKTFRIADLHIRSMIIDGPKAAVHWHANIHSKVTGVAVATELVDLVETDNVQILSYTEFFVPR